MPHRDEILFEALLREAAAERVSRRDAGDYALFKYTPTLVQSRDWSPAGRAARGIVFHVPTASVVCRPISKFFNLDEVEETRLESLPGAPPLVEEKLDGSCVSLHLRDDRVRCATPGNFASEQAIWAEGEMARRGLDSDAALRDVLGRTTLVCEAIYPENVSVVNYGGRRDVVLLAAVDLDGTEHAPDAVDALGARFGLTRPRRFDLAVSREMPVEAHEEGYVLSYWRAPAPLRVKVKGAEYLRLHPFISQLDIGIVYDLILSGEWDRLAERMPRAARERADDIAAALHQRFRALQTRVDAVHAAVRDLPTRKDQAAEVLRAASHVERGLVFAKLDGKLRDSDLWTVVRASFRGLWDDQREAREARARDDA